mgnify:CR=1 FL=1
MHILVTNDDGVNAPGLLALANAMKSLGSVSILAPDHNWSGGGHVKTLHRPLRVRETTLIDGTPALMSDGAPSDCVALAVLGLVRDPIDLVVSGINTYGNLGYDVTYSGTVTAAMEAVIAGVPGFAFSLAADDTTTERDYGPAAEYARRIVATAIASGLTKDLLLNVNVPCLPGPAIQGIRVTRQGLRVYRDKLDERRDPGADPPHHFPHRADGRGRRLPFRSQPGNPASAARGEVRPRHPAGRELPDGQRRASSARGRSR